MRSSEAPVSVAITTPAMHLGIAHGLAQECSRQVRNAAAGIEMQRRGIAMQQPHGRYGAGTSSAREHLEGASSTKHRARVAPGLGGGVGFCRVEIL